MEILGDLGDGDGLNWFHREAARAPGIEAAFERTHTGDPVMQERERRTGAGSFVWSTAIEDHLFIARDLSLASLNLVE